MSTELPNPFPVLSSGVVSITNEFEMEISQQLRVPSKITKPRQHLTVKREQRPLLPALNSQEDIVMEETQQPAKGFMLTPQTGFNLKSDILISCVKITPKSKEIPKSDPHSLGNTSLFVNPNIQNATTAVTNIANFDTQNSGVNNVSTMASSSLENNQNVTLLPTVAVDGKMCDSNDTPKNQPKNDKEEEETNTNGEEEFFCSFCSVECGSTELLEEHKREEGFICRVCTVMFNNHQELENHFFSHKKYTCDVCKKAFRVYADLCRHKITVLTCNKPARMHKCKICNNRFVHKTSLETHMEKKHPNAEPKVLPCLICKRHFKNHGQFNFHMRTEHTAYENLVCDICQKIVIGPEKLKLHIKSIHLPPPECCPICKKLFVNKHTFRNHMEKHNEEEIACDICGASVKGKTALRHHMKCHQNIIYPCKICNMTFKSNYQRRRHNNKVHKMDLSKPVICEVCGKEFKYMEILKHHMVTHSDEKPHVCEVCGAAFKLKTVLRTHSRIHSDLRKYSCNHCGEGFRWKQTYDKHVLKCESSQNEETSTQSESD